MTTLFSPLAAWLRAWRERARLRSELNRLSDRDLRDIGLTRSDLPAVISGRYRDLRPAVQVARAESRAAAAAVMPVAADTRLAA